MILKFASKVLIQFVKCEKLAFYFIAYGRNASKKVITVLATFSMLEEKQSSDNKCTVALVNCKKT